MKRLLFAASVAGLLCLGGTGARAQDYNYSFTPDQASVSASPSGSLSFFGAQNASATGTSTLVLANLQLQSSATGVDTLPSTNNALGYSGTLTITDTNGTTNSLTLSGSLTGLPDPKTGLPSAPSFSAGTATNPAGFSNIQTTPLSLSAAPGSGWNVTGTGSNQVFTWTDSKTGNTFAIPVSGLSITPPGPPQNNASNIGVQQAPLVGSISAYVVVNGAPIDNTTTTTGGSTTGGGTTAGGTTTGGSLTGGTTAGVPEPSTLVLSCFGLTFAGLAGWRKRRQAAKA